jgi:G:T/U-mismatch repair DNA glycosylase
MLSQLALKLLIGGFLLTSVVGAWVYHKSVVNALERCEEQRSEVQRKLDVAQDQVRSITEAQEEVLARQVLAEETAKKLRGDLARARGRVQTIVIPSECPAALDWLAEELK